MRAGEKRVPSDGDCGKEPPRAAPGGGPGVRKTGGIDEEKKARIIAAAVAEFAAHGYKNANTNRIVKEAGVSKGLLFHYFGSKKALYLYLYDYAMRLVIDEAFSRFDRSERDIFKRWRAGTVLKYDIMRRHGPLFEFILDAYARADDEVRNAIDALTGTWIETAWRDLRENLDLSLFRTDIDTEKAIHILFWTLAGYSRKMVAPSMPLAYYREHYDALLEGLDGYLDTLRRLLYK
ncbi:MAG: TetR/AcrR family transcriptional regulator [Clostridiales Family XIII bacterium]|jgi:AcrR family transcriptional regulator|nr:TetR/AcrR family transcriptional regulator [Clostridiales Family XIII bacterium]